MQSGTVDFSSTNVTSKAAATTTSTPQGKAKTKATSNKKQPKNDRGVKSSVASSSAPAESSASGSGKKTRRKKEKDSGDASYVKSKSSDAGAEDPVGKIRLKTVIRRMPPNLPESIFWKAVSPWVVRPLSMMSESSDPIDDSKANIDYGYFVLGKLKDSSRRRVSADAGISSHVFSRAYLHFTSIESLVAFHRGFDGHLFRDAKGSEHIAIVEFAPFQRTPLDLAKKVKADPKQGTIEEDSDYHTFLTSLEKKKAEDNGQTQAEKTDAQLMSQLMTAQSATKKQSSAKHTPLLDHLRAQHTARAESFALKNARSYLNRNNNAYAASKGGPASTTEKGKGKAKGQAKDGAIPTGPKAGKKTEAKGVKKGAPISGAKAENSSGSNLAIKGAGAIAGPKPTTKGPKGGVKGQSKGIESSDGMSILTKQAGDLQQAAVAIPTGPSADRGAPRGRAKASRFGGGRGGARGGKPTRGGAPTPNAAAPGPPA